MVKLGIDLAWKLILEANRLNRGIEKPMIEAGLGIGANGNPLYLHSDLSRAVLVRNTAGFWRLAVDLDSTEESLFDLYLPFCRPTVDRAVTIAHLGQSLDGRIATHSGASYYVTGPENITHLHRMRALADAIIVGAGTVRSDDPSLTTRRVEGSNPVRVIIDCACRLDNRYQVFQDGQAATLLLCDSSRLPPAPHRHGQAEVVAIPGGDRLRPEAIIQSLHQRGLHRIFVEGGGITVSRFLEDKVLDRLQVAIAPMIIGSGRPGITLPVITELSHALRPRCRIFPMGGDVLFDCELQSELAQCPGETGQASKS